MTNKVVSITIRGILDRSTPRTFKAADRHVVALTTSLRALAAAYTRVKAAQVGMGTQLMRGTLATVRQTDALRKSKVALDSQKSSVVQSSSALTSYTSAQLRATAAKDKAATAAKKATAANRKHSESLTQLTEAQKRNNATMVHAADLQSKGRAQMATGAGIAASGYVGARLIGSAIDPVLQNEEAFGDLRAVGITDLTVLEERARTAQRTVAGATTGAFLGAAYSIKSGISTLTDEGVADFTLMGAKIAKATKGSLDGITTVQAKAFGAFRSQYKAMTDTQFMARFGAAFTQTVAQFRTDGQQMQLMMSNLGADMTTLGIRMEEQLALGGLLQTTMEGAQAATAMRAFARDFGRSQESLQDAGYDIELFDADTGKARSLLSIMDQIKGNFGDIASERDAAGNIVDTFFVDARAQGALVSAFSAEGAKVITSLLSAEQVEGISFEKAITDITSSADAGADAIDAAYMRTQENGKATLDLFKQQFGLLVQTIAKPMLTVLTGVTTILRPIVAVLDVLLTKIPVVSTLLRYTFAIAAVGATGLAVVGGVLLTTYGTYNLLLGKTLILETRSAVVSGILTKARLAQSNATMWLARGLAYLKSPALIVPALGRAFRSLFATLKAGTALGAGKVFTSLAAGASGLSTVVSGTVIPTVVAMGSALWAALLPVMPIILAVGAALALVSFLVWKFWKPIKAYFAGFWEGFMESFAPISKAWDELQTTVSGVFSKIEPVFRPVLDLFSSFFSQTDAGTESMFTLGKVVGTVFGAIVRVLVMPLTLLTRFLEVLKHVAAFSGSVFGSISGLFGGGAEDKTGRPLPSSVSPVSQASAAMLPPAGAASAVQPVASSEGAARVAEDAVMYAPNNSSRRVHQRTSNTISVNVAGSNSTPQAIAEAVRSELTRRDRESVSAERDSFYDGY